MNRLAHESSPYLRQHADNPVDWYPWGEEAFAKAKAEDRPILLSVGYSSCHWCHVMAHESFEDGPTATIMNNLFVNVKVDREERPDVDAIYMDAVQALSGRGGWPMTVFLAPDGRPFFAGTYFPNSPRHGMPSFTQILESVHDLWLHRRDDLLAQADQLTEAIGRETQMQPSATAPRHDVLARALPLLRKQYDAAWGGFGRAPKFPQAMTLDAVLRSYLRTRDDDTLHMITNSLDAMASGGIYDHLGGGFARYSVDAHWIVPHFEKMLYDNALLARVYLHAWQVTGKERYLQVLDEIITYVLRDLGQPGGGFSSAEDADSEGEEGKFYVFSRDEIVGVLRDAGFTDDDSTEVLDWYGVTEDGNFEGHNILWRPQRGDLARPPLVERARAVLFDYRNKRVRPGLDDKVLTEWNGLMLGALADAAAATGRREWRDAAVRSAEFLTTNLRRADGRWLRSWQAEVGARHLGYAADHAAMIDALVRVYELTGEARWIEIGRETADALITLFHDDVNGGFFTTGTDGEALITRPKELMDNAVPSANSASAIALLRLGALTGDDRCRVIVDEIFRLLGELADRHPTAFGELLCALDLAAAGIDEIVIAGDRPDLLAVVREACRPNAVLAWGERFESPLWTDRDDGAAYVCRNFSCQLPARDAETLRQQLGKSIDASPLVLLVWRQVIALSVLTVFLCGRRRPLRREDLRASRYAAFMFGVHLIGFFGAARLTSVAVVLLVYALAPVLIIPIAALLLHERPDRTVVGLGAVAIVGVALVVTTGSPQGSNPTLGLIVSIGNLVLWVVWSLVIKGARTRQVDTTTWMLCANVGGLVVVLAAALLAGEDLGAVDGTDWLRVAALAIGPGLIGHGLNTWALGHVDVGLASVIGLGEPVLAALGAALFLSEPLGALQVTGIAIVIVAVAVVVARSTRPLPAPVPAAAAL